MLALDAFLRFSAMGYLIIIALIAWRDHRQWRSSKYLILACVSLLALCIGYAPDAFRPKGLFYIISRFIDVPHLIFVWLFGLSLYDREFRLKGFHVFVGIIYTFPIFWLRFAKFDIGPQAPEALIPLVSILSLLLMLHLCVVTVLGRRDDMIDSRRRFRINFFIILIFSVLLAAITEPFSEFIAIAPETVKIISIWPGIMVGVLWMFRFNISGVTFAAIEPSKLPLTLNEQRIRDDLNKIMSEQSIYKDTKLSIAQLAKYIGTQEHKLRFVINQRLGYPNFSAYINSHRVDAVKRDFLDYDKVNIPILTIAIDNGFQTISVFNRVFKELEGITPSEYRKNLKSQKA